LVKWAESVGLSLFQRDLNYIELKSPYDVTMRFKILQVGISFYHLLGKLLVMTAVA